MKLVQVKDNQIVQYNLPKVGVLKDGSTVSGYHLLGEEILKQEGWLPLEDNPPIFDEETQYLLNDGYEILEDKVVVKYRIEDIVTEEPEIVDEYVDEEKVAMAEAIIDLEMRLSQLEGGK